MLERLKLFFMLLYPGLRYQLDPELFTGKIRVNRFSFSIKKHFIS